MPSPDPQEPVLDQLQLTPLLDPIPGEKPTGDPLDPNDTSGPFFKLHMVRDEAFKIEKQWADWQVHKIEEMPDVSPDWESVIGPATELLRDTSKDLHVLAWLGEALARVHHLRGLEAGLSLCSLLTQNFWDHLHPAPDENNGHASAVAMLKRYFGDATCRALDETPLFAAAASTAPPRPARSVTFNQAKFASAFDKLPDQAARDARSERLNWISTADVQAVAASTPTPSLQDLHRRIDTCADTAKQLSLFLKENCRPDADGDSTAPCSELQKLGQQLSDMRRQVDAELNQRTDRDADETSAQANEETSDQAESSENAGPASVATGTITNREDAFREIERIAEFFDKQEPHSPVQYALRQIVRWGRMSFPELLRELLEDDKTLQSLDKRIGFLGDPPRNEDS